MRIDAAGNIGSDGLGMVDTIIYDRQRFRGADRIETAAIIAESSFASAETALIARADNFPDALSGSYLAGQLDAPLLLSNTGSLPAATAEALADLGVENVILLGGTAAISPAVEDALDDTYDVERIGGPDRYATAALIARRPGNVVGQLDGRPTAFVASGANFPDALVAGGPAYDQQFPLLLTPPGDVAAPTAEALEALGITQVIVPGGSAAVSEQVTDDLQGDGLEVIRVAGAERTQTAALLADFALERLGWTAMHANVARGDAFPDALAMGPHAGIERAPLLLTANPDTPGTAQTWLAGHRCTLQALHLAGGEVAVTAAAEQVLAAAATPDASCTSG